MSESLWFVRPKKKTKKKLNLFCFPYAGGSIGTYIPWEKEIPDDVELIAIQPPGRSRRIGEAAYTNMDDLVYDLYSEFKSFIDIPFVFFGHSLGSRIAFELCHRLNQNSLPLPLHFFASGSRAAHLPCSDEITYNLDDLSFKQKLKELNGTPKTILENEEFMQFFLPTLRADFKIAETYVADRNTLSCPVTVLGGQNDIGIPVPDLKNWHDLFESHSDVIVVPGDHFFVESNRSAVVEAVNHVINAI